jgi:hypothetical protein
MKIALATGRLARLPIQGLRRGGAFYRITPIECCITDMTTDTGLHCVGLAHMSGIGRSANKHVPDFELGPHLVGLDAAPHPVWHTGMEIPTPVAGGVVTPRPDLRGHGIVLDEACLARCDA